MACLYPAFEAPLNRCHELDIQKCTRLDGYFHENDSSNKTCYQRYVLDPHLEYCETKTSVFKIATIALSILAALSVIVAGFTLAAFLGVPFIASLVASTFISLFISKALVVSMALAALTVPATIVFGLGLCAANNEKKEVLNSINNLNKERT